MSAFETVATIDRANKTMISTFFRINRSFFAGGLDQHRPESFRPASVRRD
jgi:hypothetical protein